MVVHDTDGGAMGESQGFFHGSFTGAGHEHRFSVALEQARRMGKGMGGDHHNGD